MRPPLPGGSAATTPTAPRDQPIMILPKVRDPRFMTIRRGGTLTDPEHHLLALWAASCAEHVLDLFESDAYPLATRIGAAAGAAHGSAHDPGHAYAFGLDRILAALENLAANSPTPASKPSDGR